MTKSRKKPARRRGRGKPGIAVRLMRRGWRLFWFCSGFMLGVAGPWVIWLNHQVTSEFEGRKWDLPSRVYARPLTLYPGHVISPERLRTELEFAGYRRVGNPDRPGTFSSSADRYRIHRRPFHFDDGRKGARRFDVRLHGGAIVSLEGVPDGRPISVVRLDPAEIASIYPLHEEDRTLVSIGNAPPLLVQGLQAVEDRRFKHHRGVDLRGIGRALMANIRAGETVQGGSTITQQLVKNYYLSNDRTLSRKVNEATMAVLLEWHYDKSQIMEAYINEVYLGQQGNHGIHGFARASEFYFASSVQELQPHEIALLVGLVRGASFYNPRRHPQRALVRRNRVLDQFADTGLLSAEQARKWKAKNLGLAERPGSGRNRFPAFVELVRRQLRSNYREQDLRNEGLRIYTTLSPSDQLLAERAVTQGMEALADGGFPADLQAAMVLADVSSGEVRALVGDRRPDRPGFNRALDARRQIGSVIKPLVYLVALEHDSDFNLLTKIEDRPISLRQSDGTLWSPQNYDRQARGTVRLIDALTQSLNLATVRLGMELGVQNVVGKLAQLGVNSDVAPVPATLLGAVELTPLEVAQIYQSIAAGGYTVPLRAVTAVQTSDGRLLQRYPLRLLPLERRDAVAVLNYALTRVVASGTARELPGLLGREVTVAGKTGTTNERRDSWFVGYTRDRLAVAWVGRDDNRPAGVTGGNAAMRLWARLFRDQPLQSVSLDMPEGAYWTWVEPELNALSDPSCEGAVQLPFVAGSEPESESPCLARIDRREKKAFWRKWFERD